jgi:hypothetical protein
VCTQSANACCSSSQLSLRVVERWRRRCSYCCVVPAPLRQVYLFGLHPLDGLLHPAELNEGEPARGTYIGVGSTQARVNDRPWQTTLTDRAVAHVADGRNNNDQPATTFSTRAFVHRHLMAKPPSLPSSHYLLLRKDLKRKGLKPNSPKPKGSTSVLKGNY